MSRLSVIFSLSGFALSARPVDFPVALTIDQPEGWFVFSARVSRRGEEEISFRLESSADVHIGNSVSRVSYLSGIHTDPVSVHFPRLNNSDRLYILDVENAYIYDTNVPSCMGIAFDSRLTQQSDAVAVIRRNTTNAELVLGATRDYFNASCLPGTSMTLDVSATDGESSERFMDGVQVLLGGESFGVHRMTMGATSESGRLDVPQALFNSVREILISRGLVPDFSLTVFSGCSEAVIQSLPNIMLELPSVGSLLYLPVDYVELYSGYCSLLLWPITPGRPIVIDSLKLVGQNVRVTRENVWDICESNTDEL